MRTSIANLFTVAIMFILFNATGCSDDEPNSQEPIDQLPPATQEGKNTFGCFVNGEAWVTKTSIDASAIYQGGFLQIGANIEESNRDEGIGLRIDELISENTIYNITKVVENGSVRFVNSTNTVCFYDYENAISGNITVSKFTLVQPYIVSGTFEFTTALNGCDTIRVTNGRFDLNYIP
ncbi:MAG: DUF6252 family protein [Bacteroidota bacterium]